MNFHAHTTQKSDGVSLQDHWLALPPSTLTMPSFHGPFVFSWVPGLGCGLQANVSVYEAWEDLEEGG